MDEIKEISKKEFERIIADSDFEEELVVKDYYITILLFSMRHLKGVFFKGGTALQKTILSQSRISEDIDFTLERSLDDVRKEIGSCVESLRLFGTVGKDKDVDKFVRLVVPYQTTLWKGEINIDVNERGKLLTAPQHPIIVHQYPNIPQFTFPCLSQEEMVAEKVAAAIGRNRPRDHYDIYQIIKHKIPINMKLVEKKCKESNQEFSIIRMFNNAKKLKNRWDEDMIPLLKDQVAFHEVMQTLAAYFKLKEEKERLNYSKIFSAPSTKKQG